MPATVIPVSGLFLGFVGNISNEGYSLRSARQVNPSDTLSVAFGETFVLNNNNTYSSFKQWLLNGAGEVSSSPNPGPAIGIAASNVNINPAYNSFPGSEDVLTPGGVYVPSSIMDGLVQGTINVTCNNGTPTAGGLVYIRTALNSAVPAGVVGGLEAVVDPNPATPTITTTNASATATISSATGVTVGMLITSTNVPAGTFVAAISGTTITMSEEATAGATGTAATFTSNFLYNNFKWKTGYLETDLTAQVTILNRQIA
jgi:hypothetical protein